MGNLTVALRLRYSVPANQMILSGEFTDDL